METIFFEISAILIVGTVFATIAKLLHQPMIPAYILAGVLLGPLLLNVIHSKELLETLSTFGISFLLFLVGIELDLRKFLRTGRIAILLGFAQMIFAGSFGYVLNRFLGFDGITAILLAVALGFSSTIVALKLLEDRKELDTLYGQIVIGMMLTQDFIAILFLIFFNVFTSSAAGGELLAEIGLTLVKGFFLISVALIVSKFLLSHLFRYLARTPELLFLGSICWCLVFSVLAILLGFSIEVGSLLAGVSLAYLPYSIEISHRIKSLRDFFLPIFFAVLGEQLIFDGGSSIILPTIIFSSLVLFIYPILVIGLLLWFGYRSRTSFQSGMAVGQVSEFSFILMSLSYGAGLIERDIVSLVALIGLITMTLSAYLFEYSDALYKFFYPVIKKCERKKSTRKLSDVPENLHDHVILVGQKTMGIKIRQMIGHIHKPLVVIDHNPDTVRKLEPLGIPHLYGSVSDDEILERAYIAKADYVISTVSNRKDTMELLEYVQKNDYTVKVIVTTTNVEDALEFYKKGASFVLYPSSITADYLQTLLKKNLKEKGEKHREELKKLRHSEATA